MIDQEEAISGPEENLEEFVKQRRSRMRLKRLREAYEEEEREDREEWNCKKKSKDY